MSIISKVKDNQLVVGFCVLFFGSHYGWHLLQQRETINLGKPPAELPATMLVKYLFNKANSLMGGDASAPAQAAAITPNESKQ